MMNILIKDKIDPFVIEELQRKKFQVTVNVDKPQEILQEVQNHEVLIVRSATKVMKNVIDSALQTGNLKLIIRAGVGLDNIDVDYARSQGISVANTPEASSAAVAELVLAHMLTLARKMVPAILGLREKKWIKKQCEGIEISGKTLGIIGMGRIGQVLAQKASALGMKITYTDVMGPMEVDSKYKFVSLNELLDKSDFVSLHTPANGDGVYLIDKPEFKRMKKSAYLINAARGGLVNEDALLEALNNEEIAGAGIDVYCEEPCDKISLLQHEKVSVTPHIGASTKEAQARIGQQILKIIDDYCNRKIYEDELNGKN